jgi:VWFA-related protein
MKWAGVLAASACLVSAQQSDEVRVSAHVYTPPQLHLTVQTNLVQLEVVVRDPRGHAVGGLRQGDFEILDEGRPREIAAFSVETLEAKQTAGPATAARAANSASAGAAPNAPKRSTMLFFDDLHVAPAELQRTQLAAKRFVKDGMGPGARAAVYTASQGLVLDFTSDAAAIAQAIEKLRSHQHLSEAGLQPCPHISPYQAFLIDKNLDSSALDAAIQEAAACQNTDPTLNSGALGRPNPSRIANDPIRVAVLAQASQTWQQARIDSQHSFDAITNALTLLTQAPGTRVLLMASAGFLSGLMDAERDAATDRAIRAGIVINALDAKGLWSEAPGRQAGTTGGLPLAAFVFETSHMGSQADAVNAVMQEFASGTGGLFFHNSNDLAGGFSQLGAAPETTYLIAFRPDTEVVTAKYRKLKVRLTARNGDYVQARPGYMPAPNPAPEAPAQPRKIDSELLASDMLTQIPIELAGMMGNGSKDDPAISLFIKVDIAKLNFTHRDGRHFQKLTFIGALLDSGGRVVAAKEGAMDLALKDDTLARLAATGVRATLGLNAPPGPYHVRMIVQDAEGNMAALTQSVEIPK